MNRRTFNASELARLFKSQAHEGNGYAVDLGEGFKAVQMAEHSGLVFQIERDGKAHALAGADAAELEEISGILWAKYGDFVTSIEDDLTPDALKDEPDADPLTPDELKDKPDPENLAPDPLGLTPDHLRKIIADPGLARRLALGTTTAAEKLDDLLTPDELKEKPDPLAGTVEGLTPESLRGDE